MPWLLVDPLGPSGRLSFAAVMATLEFFATYCGPTFVDGWRAADVVLVGLLLACTRVLVVAFGRDTSIGGPALGCRGAGRQRSCVQSLARRRLRPSSM